VIISYLCFGGACCLQLQGRPRSVSCLKQVVALYRECGLGIECSKPREMEWVKRESEVLEEGAYAGTKKEELTEEVRRTDSQGLCSPKGL